MESFFAALVSASLVFTWASTNKLVAMNSSACGGHTEYAVTARENTATLKTGTIAPFGRIEAGWQIYAPQVARTIGSPCAPSTKGFAQTLAAWQSHHRLPSSGAMNAATLVAMKNTWQQARPFIAAFKSGSCPAAPAEGSLAEIAPREGWVGKISKLDPQALTALRLMVAAARAGDPHIGADPQMLTIVSAFRSPAYDAARCASEGNCNGVVRARCSAHRTGKAVDLYIGALPGH